MNDKPIQPVLKETLSALLDHEAGKVDALELRRLARALEQDPELLLSYQRYTLASAAMRGETFSPGADFLGRVQQAIASDTATPASERALQKPWLKMAGQWAVAVVAIWWAQTQQVSDPRNVPVGADASAAIEVEDHNTLGSTTHNRSINPRVLTVSAGHSAASKVNPTKVNSSQLDPSQLNASKRGQSKLQGGECIVAEHLPADGTLRRLQLPEGYVLCQMDQDRQRCHSVSASVACYVP